MWTNGTSAMVAGALGFVTCVVFGFHYPFKYGWNCDPGVVTFRTLLLRFFVTVLVVKVLRGFHRVAKKQD